MSGIGGIWSIDPTCDLEASLNMLRVRLLYRGPDRQDTWLGQSIGFVHTLLATTPEAELERQPFVDADTQCVIVGDLRLDNRDELLPILGTGRDPHLLGDAELALLGYLRWGKDCPTRFLGDFAFAIFDPRNEQIFCCRDHLGMRQLTYSYDKGKQFAFSTDPDALAALPSGTPHINEERIADFLANLEGADFVSTFYTNILRLPPAHSLIVSRTEAICERYWEPHPQPPLRLASDQEYTDAFNAVFEKAVRARLRSNGPVGVMLSGGIDSNAVASKAARILESLGGRLLCFSAVDPANDDCKETRLINLALKEGGYESSVVKPGDLEDSFGELEELGRRSTEPFDYTSVHNRAVCLIAHKAGVRVMLDGVAADVLLHAGNRVASLISEGKPWLAFREARHEADFWSYGNPYRTWLAGAWAALAPLPIRRLRHFTTTFFARNRRNLTFGRFNRSFFKRTNVAHRLGEFRTKLFTREPFGSEYLAKVLSHPNLTVSRERYDRVASHLAIEPRDPFMDLQVVKFCLSLPPSQFQEGGIPKVLLRRAMAGQTPDDIAWRRGKSHLGWQFLKAFGELRGTLDKAELPQGLSQFLEGGFEHKDTPEGWYLFEWEALAFWLEARKSDRRTGIEEAPITKKDAVKL